MQKEWCSTGFALVSFLIAISLVDSSFDDEEDEDEDLKGFHREEKILEDGVVEGGVGAGEEDV